MIGFIFLGTAIFIHILGWLVISAILYLFTQYGLTLGEFILIFFLWEIGMLVITLENYNEAFRQIFSDYRSR